MLLCGPGVIRFPRGESDRRPLVATDTVSTDTVSKSESSTPQLPPPPPWAPESAFKDTKSKSRISKYLTIAGASIAALIVMFYVAYGIDMWRHQDRVVGTVRVGATDLSGLDAFTAANTIDAAATELESKPLSVVVETTEVEIMPDDLGVGVKANEATARALGVARSGNPIARASEWIRARWLGGVDLGWTTESDPGVGAATLDAIEFPEHVLAIEPVVTFDGATPIVQTESDGRGIQLEPALALLADSLVTVPESRTPVELPVGIRPPIYDTTDAEAAISAINPWIAAPLTVSMLGASHDLSDAEIATMLRSTPGPDDFEIVVDPAAAAAAINPRFGDVTTPAVNATYTLAGGASQVVPGATGIGCCAPGSVDLITAALDSESQRVTDLGTTDIEPEFTTAALEAFGPLEPLGSFTTVTGTGGGRVFNIHKLADIMQGVVVMPGESLSVNEYTGVRGAAEGWADAGAIYDGKLVQVPGGGISQFATTIYNALYFTGVQVDEHRSHSIYISRYPKGREATFGYPHPDIAFTNDTPGPLLIWPTYTSNEITVTMWGISDGRSVKSSGPISSSFRSCEIVKDIQTITWPDGRQDVRKQSTTYRASPGQPC